MTRVSEGFENPGSLESPEGVAVSMVLAEAGYLEVPALYSGFLGVLEKFVNTEIPGTVARSGHV